MKDQYFTDERDFFKWDFLEDLLDSLPELSRFTNLAMMTPPDRSGEGGFVQYPCGNRRRELYQFLHQCRNENRVVMELARHYAEKRFAYWQHPETYMWDERDQYFGRVTADQLADALIFFDPDIGLERRNESYMRNQGIDKYLADDSLQSIAARSKRSVIVVYQHLQRDKRLTLANARERCQRLQQLVGTASSHLVCDGDIAFLTTTNNPLLTDKLRDAVNVHAKNHHLHQDTITEHDGQTNGSTTTTSTRPTRATRALHPCACGCGGQTRRTWCPGHDAIAASATNRAKKELGHNASAEALQHRVAAILQARWDHDAQDVNNQENDRGGTNSHGG
jgi:hypothetical protein